MVDKTGTKIIFWGLEPTLNHLRFKTKGQIYLKMILTYIPTTHFTKNMLRVMQFFFLKTWCFCINTTILQQIKKQCMFFLFSLFKVLFSFLVWNTNLYMLNFRSFWHCPNGWQNWCKNGTLGPGTHFESPLVYHRRSNLFATDFNLHRAS